MATVTLSLPAKIIRQVDQTVIAQGFSTRSEYIRTLLRQALPISKSNFNEFEKRPLSEIKKDLALTGKYDQKFIDSVINGLKKSSIYADKAAKI